MVSQSKEERFEEAKTTESLMSVVKFDMDNSNVMEVVQRRDQDYAAEMSLLPNAWDMGLPQGLAAGLFSLAFFSRGNSIILQRDRGTSPFGAPRTPASSAALKLSLYTFSLTVSFANMFLVSVAFQDKNKILSDLAKTPLVEGRSVLADSFCDDLSKEYRRIHSPEYWQTVQSPFLRHAGDFVHNCDLRRSYERKLRKERGMMPGEPVSVPPPGVPTTTSDYNDDDSHDGGDGDFELKQEEEAFVGDDWANTFVTDQEDSDSNEWK